jgi:hypothetical protein
MFSGIAQVSHQVCQFFCQFCVSMVENQGCRLLFASDIAHNVIQKEEK